MSNITTQNRIARQLDGVTLGSRGFFMLQHFDYPETWSYEGATFSSDAKFGKNCLYFPATNSKAVVTNTTGVFNLLPLGNYEAECFVKFTDDDYKCYDGHTFKYFATPLTWSEAKAACERMGGHLATSTSAEKNTFLTTMTNSLVWLGGTDEADEGTWEWLTGEEWSYTSWGAGEPNNTGGIEYYLSLDGVQGTWNDTSINATYPFICEWDSDYYSILRAGDLTLVVSTNNVEFYDTDYAFFGGHTFKYFSTTMTWAEAKAACEALGGHLATSTSNEKNTFLTTLTTAETWLGGTDEETEGTWKWITGEEWSYTSWYTNNSQPDNYQNNQHYLEINFDSLGRWGDDYQTATHGYICEWNKDFSLEIASRKLKLSSTTFNIDSSKAMTGDTLGFSFYDGHTFKYFSTAMTFAEANAACEALGGHLAASENSEKTAFLSGLTGSTTWLGVTENTTTETRTYICEWDYDVRNNYPYTEETWLNTWHHILLRITGGYIYIFIDGAETIKAYISSQVELSPERVELGGYIGYMDEFAFRRNAGKGTPTVPLAPYEISIPTKIPTNDAPVTRVAWSAIGLPEGLTLSESGQLTGHPTTAGSYDSTVTVTTNWGTARKTVTIVVTE